jgi:hypothetical protein
VNGVFCLLNDIIFIFFFKFALLYKKIMANTFQALNAQTITPSDTVDITLSGSPILAGESGACIYVGTGGNLTVTMLSGQVVAFLNVSYGSFLPIQVKRVWATGTTATNMLSLY